MLPQQQTRRSASGRARSASRPARQSSASLSKSTKTSEKEKDKPVISAQSVLRINPHVVTEEEETWSVSNWPSELRNMYVITIRPERMEAFRQRMGRLMEYTTVVNGVDGSKLDKTQLVRDRMYKTASKWSDLNRGELGCFLSHKSVWQHFLTTDKQYACIMEDDLDLRPFQEITSHLQTGLHELNRVSPKWSLLYLSRNPAIAVSMRQVSPHILATNGRSWGLFFYVITRPAAEFLLKESRTIHEAVDIFVSTKIRGFALYPRACSVHIDKSDTVGIK